MSKKKDWRCFYCDKTYVTESQICPKCHRVMTLVTEKNKSKKAVIG